MSSVIQSPQAQLGGASAPSVLGAMRSFIPVGGTIRSGIKVLTKTAQKNTKACQLYEKGVADGKDFDTIENEIREAIPEIKHPLTPKNTSYFTVRAVDFPMGEIAKVLVDKYGEDRGDGVKRLYRFPVIFPVDSWLMAMPHSLKCYGSSRIKYWSEYSEDGKTRYCMTYAPVQKDPETQRLLRTFGGRKPVPRAENSGICDPEKCREYQTRQCNLSAKLIFMVPGIPSINAIELPTGSYYSMDNIRRTLFTVASLRGGRISGYLHGDHTFWVTKVQSDVPMIDEEGNSVMTKQWLITLEADVDVGGLLLSDANQNERLANAGDAAHVLSGEARVLEIAGESDQVDRVVIAPDPVERLKQLRSEVFSMVQDAGISADVYSAYAKSATGNEGWSRDIDNLEQARKHLLIVGAMRGQLAALLDEIGIDKVRFERYGVTQFGARDWMLMPDLLKLAIQHVEEHQSTPDVLSHRVENVLEPV